MRSIVSRRQALDGQLNTQLPMRRNKGIAATAPAPPARDHMP
ncbi:MAG TPA: hypothetical protein VF793_18795 [Telluria sp.]